MLIENLNGPTETDRINKLVRDFVGDGISEKGLIEQEIQRFLKSPKRKLMLTGIEYYHNRTDIRKKVRKLKGIELQNKSNQKLAHAFTRKITDQKVGYLLSKNPTISSDSDVHSEILNKDIFSREMLQTLKQLGEFAVTEGIAWLHPYVSANGALDFKIFRGHEVLPFYVDDKHYDLDSAVRIYNAYEYHNDQRTEVTKVEHYTTDGVYYYILEGNALVPDVPRGVHSNYLEIDGDGHNWDKVPLVPFRYNSAEQPLVDLIKSLVDVYDLIASTDSDLIIDLPNFIIKLINYGGEDLDEFLLHLNELNVVSVDENGDVGHVKVDPDTANTNLALQRTREAIYEFGRGVDVQNEDMGNVSGEALKFRYADLDLDCNVIENLFQVSLERLMYFVNTHLNLTNKGDFTNESFEIIFNRDIIINEQRVIEMCRDSVGVLDDATIRKNHPWYVPEVEERLEKQNDDDYSIPPQGDLDE